jgi:hypothetical protein
MPFIKPLWPLIADSLVHELIITPLGHILVDRGDGREEIRDVKLDGQLLILGLQIQAHKLGLAFSKSSHLEFRLPGGAWIWAVWPAPDELFPAVNIRFSS